MDVREEVIYESYKGRFGDVYRSSCSLIITCFTVSTRRGVGFCMVRYETLTFTVKSMIINLEDDSEVHA